MAAPPASPLLGIGAKPTGTDAQGRGLQSETVDRDHENAERVAQNEDWPYINNENHKNGGNWIDSK